MLFTKIIKISLFLLKFYNYRKIEIYAIALDLLIHQKLGNVQFETSKPKIGL